VFRVEPLAIMEQTVETPVGDDRNEREDADRHHQFKKRESAEKFPVNFPPP
jgi:hypothetical protein